MRQLSLPEFELEDAILEFCGPEGYEFEAKEAHGKIGKGFWESVSAFANSEGGVIGLGLEETDDGWQLRGVARANAMKLDLHTHLRNPHTISREVATEHDVVIRTIDGKDLIFVRIVPVRRSQRPVFIKNDPNLTYVRRSSGDFLCTEEELLQMRREASIDPTDMRVIPELNIDDFDHAAIERYRDLCRSENPQMPHHRLTGKEFLEAIGAWRNDRARRVEGPTFAGVLMFGKELAIREVRPNHVIDYRRVPSENTAQRRWIDRVRWTGHLFGAWEEIFPRLTRGLPVPFQLEGVRRVDRPSGLDTLREAFVNLLVHTDYQEAGDAVINHLDDGYVFRNPGDSRVRINPNISEFGRSERRNPTIANLFHYARFADQAGSGFMRIFEEWRSLGYRWPRIETGAGAYTFEIDLRLISFVSAQDKAWLESIGEQFSEAEQLALLLVRYNGTIDNQTLRNAIGKNLLDTSRVLGRLKSREYLVIHGSGRHAFYEFGPKLSPGYGGERTVAAENARDSGTKASSSGTKASSSGTKASSSGTKHMPERPETSEISPKQWSALSRIAAPLRTRERATPELRDGTIVQLCIEAAPNLREIELLTGRGPRIIRGTIKSLIARGELTYLYPDRPNHPFQRYTANRDRTGE